MKSGKKGLFLGWLLIFFSLSACTGKVYQFAKVELDPEKYEILGEGSANATGLLLFSLIPIGQNEKIEVAVKRVIEEKGGDDLINISIREKWYWAYILNIFKVEVSGTVIRKKIDAEP